MLLVCDLDGTLVDSGRDLADAANALVAARGGRPLPEEAIAAMVGEGAAVLVRRVLAAKRRRRCSRAERNSTDRKSWKTRAESRRWALPSGLTQIEAPS